jgi:hypothetical protein
MVTPRGRINEGGHQGGVLCSIAGFSVKTRVLETMDVLWQAGPEGQKGGKLL